MLKKSTLEHLKLSKNLLAFSAGSDSSALFFMLLEQGIAFDMVMVDYGVREQSKQEVEYAKKLASKYDKELFLKKAPKLEGSFEKEAREFRYEFFKEVIQKHNYTTLITAHHLGDMFEWFLMQLSKGAGLAEIVGSREIEDMGSFTLIKPLLYTPKSKIDEYLKTENIKHFIDETNSDTTFKRNYFRKRFAEDFLAEYEEGVKRSLEYLALDKELFFTTDSLLDIKNLSLIASKNDRVDIYNIDRCLKKLGILASKEQRDEILKQKDCVVAGKVAVVFEDDVIFIAPYVKIPIDKEIRDKLRVMKIPPKIRGYITDEGISLEVLKEVLLC
ncbi:MAG: tRNA lysidine(34) synthetase TilS [Campylobacterales bacterium]